MLFTADKKL